ncbi:MULTISPECIES: hypothetical protein [Cyanophyceae]|uniref:hypothetical protein n=1 Tax=Cyanophyceae TaxID=3028117 RepID=UPI002330F13A|nr:MULTISPECIES: hypothetical protein [Cyanophyceae]MDB9355883.1 hypothetical protein [Nodularia spumigena CS-587/03]MDB9322587.1 hypothetical protein [Nodularia spumigena CS-591/07A]MDB9332905.1 hypothetical protein [Nodularia spumigena CS-591/04]MDB9339711.1 hypothetical protein [Nodularia spumigena CS-589/07]MDB9346899.1 hypothetical protein [Nodularia spumigena CS-588/01]
MTKLELRNHQVWRDLTEILETLDPDLLVKEHLESCDYKVCGYWDEQDKYHETITLPRNLEALLVSSSIGLTNKKRFIQLKFSLINAGIDITHQPSNNSQKLGELVLVYDENLEFVDENWLLDIASPYITQVHTNQ